MSLTPDTGRQSSIRLRLMAVMLMLGILPLIAFVLSSFLIQAALPALIVIVVLVVIAGILFSRALTQPLKQLHASEQRLDLAIKGAQMGLWEWNVATGEALFNERFTEMLGYEPEEIAPHIETWKAMIHPDDLQRVSDNHQRHFKNHDSDCKDEYRLKTKTGDWIWVIDHAKVVRRDESGRPASVVSTIADITERKQLEKELLARAYCEKKLAQCSHSLLTDKSADKAITEALTHMLAASEADRAYIFENFQDPITGLSTRQRYEVCAAGVEPLISDPALQHVVYDRVLQRWPGIMSVNGIVKGLIRDFPEKERAFLAAQDIKSILCLPIMVGGEWFGIVGFDDCTKERTWSENNISILQTAAEMIGTYFERKRAETITTMQRDLAVALGGVSNLNEALELCLDTALEASEMDAGGIYLLNDKDKALNLALHKGLSKEFIRASAHCASDSPQTKMVMTGVPIYAAYDKIRPPESEEKAAERLAAIAVIPIKHEEKVIACLNISSHLLEDIPTTTRNILETIAAQIGSVIAHLRAEQEIRQLMMMVEQAGEGVAACDMGGEVMFLNTAFARMHGHDNPGQLIGKHISAFHTPEHMASEVLPLKKAVVENGIQSGVIHHLRKDGAVFPADETINIIKGENDSPIATIAFITDITERKIAQDKLEKSERMFRGIYDNANDGVCLVNTEDKTFFMCNNKFCDLLGYTETELKNMRVKDIHPQDSLKFIYKFIDDIITKKSNVFAKDVPAVKKNGVVFYSDISGAMVSLMGKEYVIGMFRDITERKKAEDALKSERDRAQHYLDVAGVILIAIEADHTISLINKAGCRILECEEKDILGKDWFETFLPPEVKDNMKNVFNQLITGKIGNTEYYENEIITAKGKRRTIAWHNSVLRDKDGKIVATLDSGEDITERKKLENQLLQAQKMQTLGTLAGGVAHDYNNLLVGVLGFASLISSSPEATEKIRLHSAQIENTAQRMADLTRQLLGFGRGGKWTTRIIDVNDSVRESVKMIHGPLRSEVSIKLRLSPRPCCIEGDPGQILQVITNCCINAIEATDGGGTITIKTAAKFSPTPSGKVLEEWKPGDYVHIEIADTGCGMNRQTVAKMFEPYFSTKTQGRGLGMAAVFGIIKNHQGWLSVETEPGSGTRMHIYLPHVEGKPQKTSTAELTPPTEKSSGKIIVIDDERVVRDLCRDALKKIGYNVLTAHSGSQGLKLLEKHPDCNLLLLDMVIPRPDGRKVFKKARDMYPKLDILLTSGHDDHGNIAKLIKKGAAGFLAKPFTAKELSARIGTILNASGQAG